MKKVYYFWFDESESKYNSQKNCFSSTDCTLKGAYKWANMLLKYNQDKSKVYFQSHNGRKIYKQER